MLTISKRKHNLLLKELDKLKEINERLYLYRQEYTLIQDKLAWDIIKLREKFVTVRAILEKGGKQAASKALVEMGFLGLVPPDKSRTQGR